MEVACLVKLQPQIEAICDAAQFVPCAAFPSSLLCSITSLWQTCSCHHCSSAVVLSGVGTVQQWGWWGWAGAGLGPSCILDVHWIELCILEGKEKTHILRVLWRFRALYQKAALMESLGGGSVKQKFPIASQAAFVLSSLLVTFPAMECIGGEPRARRAFWGTFGTD